MTSDPRRQAVWDRAEIPYELRGTYSLSGLREVLGFVAPESTNVWSRGWRSGRSVSDDGTTLWCVESVHFAHCVDLRRNMSRVQIGGSGVMHRVVGQIPWCHGVVLDGHGGGYLHDGDTLERRFRVIRGGAVGPLALCDARRLVALRGWSSGRGEETAITRVGRRHATALRVLPLGAPFAFSPSGDVFAGIAEKFLLRVMSIDAGDVLWEAPLPSRDAHAVAVADEGRAAFVALATFDRDPTTRELRDHSLLCVERGDALRSPTPAVRYVREEGLARRAPAHGAVVAVTPGSRIARRRGVICAGLPGP